MIYLLHLCFDCRLITHRSTEQNRFIFSDPILRVSRDEIQAEETEEISNLPAGVETKASSDNKSQPSTPKLPWSHSSQKRGSYVAAISSSQINLDDISTREKALTMEEILLQDRGKDRSRSLNGNEMTNKVRDFVNQTK